MSNSAIVRGISREQACEIARSYPGVDEGIYHGQPTFLIRKKYVGRIFDDNESFVLRVEEPERGFLLAAQPETFYALDRYAGRPFLLIRLAEVDADEFQYMFEGTWRRAAPKYLQKEYDAQKGGV